MEVVHKEGGYTLEGGYTYGRNADANTNATNSVKLGLLGTWIKHNLVNVSNIISLIR